MNKTITEKELREFSSHLSFLLDIVPDGMIGDINDEMLSELIDEVTIEKPAITVKAKVRRTTHKRLARKNRVIHDCRCGDKEGTANDNI
jgi:hypothetical protein